MKNTPSLHCFLIDDDPEEIDIFQLALADLNLNVTCTAFTSCHEALHTLIKKEIAPDCIFLDLYMGATSGKECLTMIVNTELISRIPTVILSGSRNEPEVAELKKMGAQEFIVKSLTINGLAEQLRHYFSTYFNSDRGLTI